MNFYVHENYLVDMLNIYGKIRILRIYRNGHFIAANVLLVNVAIMILSIVVILLPLLDRVLDGAVIVAALGLLGDGADLVVALPVLVLAELAAVAGHVATAAGFGRHSSTIPTRCLKKSVNLHFIRLKNPQKTQYFLPDQCCQQRRLCFG